MAPPNSPGAVRIRGKDDACCGLEFLKYVLFIFNFIFWLSGLAILAVGLWTLFAKHSFISLLTSATFPATTYMLIGTGGIIILIGIIGCCGAWRENTSCLMTYAAFLLLIFLLEAVIGILAYIYEANVQDELSKGLKKTMQDNFSIDIPKTQAIDDMQTVFECCGAVNYLDWRDSRWVTGNPLQNYTVPDSCCISIELGCAQVSQGPSNIYYTGCTEKLSDFLRDHLIILGAVGIGLSCLQIFGIVFACCLVKRIREAKHRHYNQW